MKRKTLLLMMLMALFSGGAWAQFSGGSGTESDPYLISSSSNWNTLASNVNSGTSYSGKYFRLTSDITITSSTNSSSYMVGTMNGETSSGNYFAGIFNGDGHTITINYTTTSSSFYYTAPFRYISGATIKNLKVAGSMNVYKYMGSLVGYCMGTNNIENCVSEVAITGTISGDATMGGLISHVHGGTTYIRGCVFKGKLLGSSSNSVGGFIGWTDHGSAYSYFYDCVFAPSQVTVSTTSSATFSRGNSSNSSGISVYNSYYTQTHGTTQGSKLQYTITAGNNVSNVALGNNPVEYNLSGITGYNSSSGYGIKYNNTIYAASGNSVKLNLSSTLTTPQYSASAGSLSGTSNPYTLSMTSSNTVISATDGGSSGDSGDSNCEEFTDVSTVSSGTSATSGSSGSTPSDYLPENWKGYGASYFPFAANHSSYMASSSNFPSSLTKPFMYFKDSSSKGCFLALPYKNVSEVSFMYAFETTSNSTLEVGYMTDISSSTWYNNTFNSVTNGTCTNNGQAWGSKTVSFSNVSASTYYVVFKFTYTSSSWYSAAIDHVCVTLGPPTEISTVTDWEAFCSAVNNGHDYYNETVKLMNDITTAVTTMAGTSTDVQVGAKAFKGTFDGQGHTLTISLTKGTSTHTAPFVYINGATIKNLNVEGENNIGNNQFAGGLVGISEGTNTITNCKVNVTINSTTSGDGTHGGFISLVQGGTTTFNGCAFTGKLLGANTHSWGGYVGYSRGTSTLNNCVFVPQELSFSNSSCYTFVRSSGTCNNCYYTETIGSAQGKKAYTISGSSTNNVTVAFSGNGTTYGGNTTDIHYITSYSTGIAFNNGSATTLYASSSETVSLNLTSNITNGIFYADNATITGSGNPYSLTMPSANVVVKASQSLIITVTADPVAGGSVSGGGTFASGASCTLTATANTGYTFANWTKNNVVVSTNASYTFTVSEDATYVANFEEWGVFITSTPASTENLTPGTEVVLTASTNVSLNSLGQYAFSTGTDASKWYNVTSTTNIMDGTTSGDYAVSTVHTFADGFSFPFAGTNYTQFSVNADGNLRLGGTVTGTNNYSNPFSSSYANSNNPKINGMGFDGFFDVSNYGNYVHAQIFGEAPNRVYVVEFKESPYTSNYRQYTWNWQVQLSEDGTIQIVYGSTAPGSYNYTNQIGLCVNASDGWTVSTTTHEATHFTNGTSTTNTAANSWPGNNRYYRFSPVTYEWTYTGTAGTANGNVYTVTPTENSTYTVSVTVGGQTYSETVDVTLTNTCATPTNLQCTYYNRTSATLSWTAGGDETQWHVQYGVQGSPNPQILSTEDNPYVLTLTEGYTYEIKVRAVCDNENEVWSDWSTAITVTPQALTYLFTNNGGSGNGQWNKLDNWQYSDPNIAVTTLPTINDNVQINAACTIPSGCLAKANEITFLTEAQGSITIEDGGQLQHNNTGVSAIVQKSITGYGASNVNTNMGYHLISSPLTGTNMTGDFVNLIPTNANEYDLYSFNYANDDGLLEWVEVNGEEGDKSLDNTVGYLYARQTDAIISTPEGKILPSNTDKPVYLQYDGNGTYRFDGWNLVGNPFVCNAYVSGFEGQDNGEGGYQPSSTAAQLSYYVLNSAGNEFVVPQPLGAIAPMGAVMVQATAANQLAVFSRTAPASKGGSLNLNITGNATRGTIDRAVLAFGNTMPLGKFQLNPDHTKVYIPMDGNDYAVAKVEGAGAVPVNFKAEHSGRYTISVNAEEVSFNYLHLIDNMTGADIDLLETPSYSFEAKTTDYESRFKLVFATGEGSDDDNFAFFSNGTYVINNDGDATLQVIDLTGRVLSSERISGACSKAINAAPGVYMLRLVNGNSVRTQKVIVK